MKFYAIIIDRESGKSYLKFHEEFTEDERIRKWWHYIDNTYLVGTNSPVNEIANLVAEYLKKHGLRSRHLAIEVNLNVSQGRLPDKAWEWILKNSD